MERFLRVHWDPGCVSPPVTLVELIEADRAAIRADERAKTLRECSELIAVHAQRHRSNTSPWIALVNARAAIRALPGFHGGDDE